MPPLLSAEAISQQLDVILEVEYSYRDTETPAKILATLPHEQQQYIIDWVKRTRATHIELGYQYACLAKTALASMERYLVEEWALYAMDIYDRFGLHKALAVMHDLPDFVEQNHQRVYGCTLSENEGVLQGFVHGLSGRKLRLQTAQIAYTDSENIYLPTVIATADTPEANFFIYKASVTLLWAQTWFGSFHASILNDLLKVPEKEQSLLIQWFHYFESLRLEGCIERELHGLYRKMQALQIHKTPAQYLDYQQRLQLPTAKASLSLQFAKTCLAHGKPPATDNWHGVFNLGAVQACQQQRIDAEKQLFRMSLKAILAEEKNKRTAFPRDKKRFQAIEDPHEDEPSTFSIELDGKPLSLPENLNNTLKSIVQDLSALPEEYLEPAGDGEYDAKFEQIKANEAFKVGTDAETGVIFYDEWDYKRKNYHKNWCTLREKVIVPVHDDFYATTLNKYQGLVKHLRKVFEALRDENKLLKRQTDGEDVDLDALVEALADANDGREMTSRLFTRMYRSERDIAVVFMVDMSGSTKGWINEAERESLILLSEALETLGDRYAIYGFSGMTRKRCEIYPVKTFEQIYDDEVKARINGIQAKDYTRMGFAIRHLSHILQAVPAKTRVLITLSDGKPDDYDGYRGQYGIEDTRKALIDARRDGIHPYCITIDDEAKDYLPHLYGAAAYTVVDNVRDLPLKVSDIYRRLTT